jgi:peroxiredoxin
MTLDCAMPLSLENKMKFCKHAFILLLFITICVIPVSAVAIETGSQAPDFKLKNLDGQEVSLSDFKGQLVLLKLATTWCPTCKQLSAEIDKVGEFLKEKNVVFLEVFVQDSQAMIEKYLGDTVPPMTFHALLDDEQVYKAYNVYLIPRFLVVDAEQRVRFDSAGRNVLATDIKAMVEEFSPPVATNGSS